MAGSAMIDFEVDGIAYRAKRLDAMSQFMLSLKLTPILVHADPLLKVMRERAAALAEGKEVADLGMSVLAPLSAALAEMSEESQRSIMRTLLSTVYRQQGPGLVPVYDLKNDQLNPQAEVEGLAMVKIAWRVFEENLGSFFGQARGLTSLGASAA